MVTAEYGSWYGARCRIRSRVRARATVTTQPSYRTNTLNLTATDTLADNANVADVNFLLSNPNIL
jgi:hypothetical protein